MKNREFTPIVDLYVVIRKGDRQGFVIPEGNTSAIRKRKETAHNWVRGYGHNAPKDEKGTVHENKGMLGFKIESFTSRYSTSNKFIKVHDPRGWIIDMSIENFVDLCKISTIEKGEFKEELVYVNSGSWLTRADDVRQNKTAKPSAKKTAPQTPGDIVDLNDTGHKMRYAGEFEIEAAYIDYGSRKVIVKKRAKYFVYASTGNVFNAYKTQIKGTIVGRGDSVPVFDDDKTSGKTLYISGRAAYGYGIGHRLASNHPYIAEMTSPKRGYYSVYSLEYED